MIKTALIFGTRPEAIKLCPLVMAMREDPDFEPRVCVTAQHRSMLDQVLDVFDVSPDADLDLMIPDQTLAGLTSRAVAAIDSYLEIEKPDLVIVQGDTTTVLCAALAAFYRNIPVGHVEAGLRTWRKRSPFPEEINRVLTSRIADIHFAPTEWSADNLRDEGIPAGRIHVTGNTVIDALHIARERISQDPPAIPGLPADLFDRRNRLPLVLITGHRRENFGDGMRSICRAIRRLADDFPNVRFVYPVHMNPHVRGPVGELLSSRENIHLLDPMPYLPFVRLMDRATLVLTDSGGIQEEAPALGKPVLVMRETTERPEGVDAGTVLLVGSAEDPIIATVTRLLVDGSTRDAMAKAANPYGDGNACGRIIDICRNFLDVTSRRDQNSRKNPAPKPSFS